MPAPKKAHSISGVLHPEAMKLQLDWILWKLAYEGGPDFVKACLKRYSRRESILDFKERLDLAHNPAHVTKALNRYRNAILSAMHEVKREGDPKYLTMCDTNVDLQNNSMTSFMGLQFLPLLMAQGKRFICIDAPAKGEEESKADEPGLPWLWCVDAENVTNWSYDDDGQLKVLCILESIDDEDSETGLVTSTCERTRYMRLSTDPKFKFQAEGKFEAVGGVGVLVRFLDKDDKDLEQPVMLQDFPRLPVVEVRMVQALCKDVAGHAKTLVNLNSTDNNFLFRGNFPIFTKQRDGSKAGIKPVNKHNPVTPGRETETQDRTVDGEDQRPSTEAGVNKGQYYDMKAERPGFVGPSTENLKASMEKQKEIREEIDQLLDLAMASQAKGKLQQSGESKKADRVDLDAGLGCIGQLMETAEREVAEIVHLFLGSTVATAVKYPKTYSIKSEDERLENANKVFEVADKPNDAQAQCEMHKRGVELMLGTLVDADTMQKIKNNLDDKVKQGKWFDLNGDRALAVQADALNTIGSKAGCAARRWFPESEAAEAQTEASAKADALSGGPPPAPPEGGPPQPKVPSGLPPPKPPESIPVGKVESEA